MHAACAACMHDHLPPVAEAALLSAMDCVYSAAGAIACAGAGQARFRVGMRPGLSSGLGRARLTQGSLNLYRLANVVSGRLG